MSREIQVQELTPADIGGQFQSISDALPILIAQFDKDERYQFHNKFHLSWFALPDERISGRHVREVFGDNAYQQLQPYIRSALKGSKISAELKVDIPALGERYLMIHLIPGVVQDGKVSNCFALMNDITGIKTVQAEKSQYLLKTAHQSRIHTMGEMLAEISHELNQPLTAISNYSAAGLRRCEKKQCATDDFTELLASIDSEVNRAVRIINHIRGFARKRSVQLELLDINQLIRDVLDLLTAEFHWHGIGLTTNLQMSGMEVYVDRILMEQVILNITRNAIEALSPVKRKEREIIITSHRSGSDVVIDIYNNGPILGKELMNRIFEPFFTTKPEGLGIGLSTSQSIMTSFNGTLWVKQNSTEGITFEIQLPARR